MRKNKMMTSVNDINETVRAEENMNDIVELIAELKRDRETLLHTAVRYSQLPSLRSFCLDLVGA